MKRTSKTMVLVDELRAIVELEGMSVPVGRTKRLVCPRCGGGSSKEKSFVIYHDANTGDLQGDCKRASCNLFVRPHAGESVGYARARGEKLFEPKVCPYPRIPLTVPRIRTIGRKFGISRGTIGTERWEYIPSRNRYYFPLYDRLGSKFGSITKIRDKSLLRDGEPKTVLYLEKRGMQLHWPLSVARTQRYTRLFVVEDVISATRVAQYAPCIAMLGTNLTPVHMLELSMIVDELVLMFDNDAYVKSCKYRDKFDSMFTGGIIAKLLTVDPKNIKNDTNLKKLLDIID